MKLKKLYIGVFGNYFENIDRAITQSTGVIRVDACEKLDVYSNIVKTSSEYQGFFQSVGDLDYAEISDNLVLADFFLRLTQADGKKYGIISINDNIFNALPLNGRSESNTNAFSSFAYVNMVNQSFDLLTSNNNKISAEGRVFWLGGTQSMAKVQLIENSIKSSHKVSYLISNVNELKMYRNESFSCDIFASLASLNNSVLDIRENIEHSDVTKNRGMFNSMAGSLKSFTFIENKFDVPNPDTYGIINSVTNITDILEKNVRDNSPEVFKTKILVSSTKFGTTLARPTNKVRDYDGYYDIDFNKKIFWDGINWKDSSGNVV
ncbi:hypothetical protein [Chryseobacterium tongliaoense]|uniref:hypothetical protein n=1 Tax=Chryseobacterium tongliaoense TaxID=3240933 RepID=UPI0035123BB8